MYLYAPSYQGFNLLNHNATSTDMEDFFNLWNKKGKSELEAYLFEDMEPYKWRYTDLLGTAYLREDQLEKALRVYETIPDSVWRVTNHDLHYYYKQELNANPFETRFTTSAFSEDRSVSYTKPAFVKELIRLKAAVKNNPKHRAYHYMLLGNAYYNMTYYGNSWYYTEYGKTRGETSSYVGFPYGLYSSGMNDDYLTGKRALNYYQLAETTSNSTEFSAFCYRLQLKCLQIQSGVDSYYDFSRKKYDRAFKKKYPRYYDDLWGCDRFDYYFDKWKEA